MKRTLALVVVLVAGGCIKKKAPPPPPPEITDVRVNYRDQPLEGAPALDVAALDALARTAALPSTGMPVHEDAGSEPPRDPRARRYKLRVDLALESAVEQGGPGKKPPTPVMRALVAAKLVPLGNDPNALSFEQQVAAEQDVKAGKGWQGFVERALKDCLTSLGARVRLSEGSASAIVAAIESSDDDLREEGMRLASERRTKEAVPSLVKLLKGDSPAWRDRAIGTLSEIGDARAVRPLTEVAKFYDVTDLPKVLDALATIGGPEAKSYLEFVASGHDNPEMRELAKQALAHLERREAAERRDLGADATRLSRH